MDMASTMTEMGISMKVSGRIICPMEKDKLSMLMVAGIMENSSITGDKVKESSCRKGAFLRGILPEINFKEKALWKVIMERDM